MRNPWQIPAIVVILASPQAFAELPPCTPDCTGRACGPDGCGGVCGACDDGFECSEDGTCVSKECAGITYEGCCDSVTSLKYCDDDGKLQVLDCTESWPPFCGYDAEGGFYDCGLAGEGSDDEELPYACTQPCAKTCTDKVCGPDGCGGLCGECPDDQFCDAAGKCQASDCGDATYEGCCDPDGKLHFCDGAKLQTIDCAEALYCGWNADESYYDCETDGLKDPSGDAPYSCSGTCTPACTGKQCGPDGCGDTCGTCGKGKYCETDGTCQEGECGDVTEVGCCEPDGTLKYCEDGKTLAVYPCNTGEDAAPFCGWDAESDWYSCGTDGLGDPSGKSAYSCTAGCKADCAGRDCGPDGCGGTCGTCSGGGTCGPDGKCAASECGEITDAGCCDGEVMKFCSEGKVAEYDCATQGKVHCGWSADAKSYICGTDGAEDPAGAVPKACPGAAKPEAGSDVAVLDAAQSEPGAGQDTAKDPGVATDSGNPSSGGGGGCAAGGSAAAAIPLLLMGLGVMRRR